MIGESDRQFCRFLSALSKIAMSIGMLVLVGRLEFYPDTYIVFAVCVENELKESDDSSKGYIGRCDF